MPQIPNFCSSCPFIFPTSSWCPIRSHFFRRHSSTVFLFLCNFFFTFAILTHFICFIFNIAFSVLFCIICDLFLSSFLIGHVCAPYETAGIIHVLKTFDFNSRLNVFLNIFFKDKNFAHPTFILFSTYFLCLLLNPIFCPKYITSSFFFYLFPLPFWYCVHRYNYITITFLIYLFKIYFKIFYIKSY